MSMSANGKRRKPAVSGAFYPGTGRQLHFLVDSLLAKAKPTPGSAPKAIVVPHAGYEYSGIVAAAAFKALAPVRESVRRVVLLGPSHQYSFRGVAMPSADDFETPLGAVPVSREACQSLEMFPFVKTDDRIHKPEHSLEVELPFLQVVLGDFHLVPLVTGEATPYEVAAIIDLLWGKADTLIVISTDLSHFHDQSTAELMDESTCGLIEKMAFDRLGPERACGHVALAGMLLAGKTHGLKVRTLDLSNSGEVTGDKASVVGYGAWGFYEREAIL